MRLTLFPSSLCLSFALALDARGQGCPTAVAVAGPSSPPVTVHVTSNRPDTMFGLSSAFGPERRHGGFNYSSRLCTAPCSVTVAPSDGPFRVVGPDIGPSARFQLSSSSSELDVTVRAHSDVAYGVGAFLTVVGAAFSAVGTALLVIEQADGETALESAPGIGFLSGATLLVAIGIPLWVTMTTRVDVRRANASALRFVPGGIAF